MYIICMDDNITMKLLCIIYANLKNLCLENQPTKQQQKTTYKVMPIK
jgi:hypothetical protein